MASYPELLIVKRFLTGNIYNVLVLQAELINIEVELAEAVVADQSSGDADAKTYAEWVYKMKTCENGNSQQWKIFCEYRRLLQKYSVHTSDITSLHPANSHADDAVLVLYKLINFNKPNKKSLATLQEWLQQKSGGGGFLHDPEHKVWKENLSDLVSLYDTGDNDDPLSRLIANKVIPWFYDKFDHRRKKGILPLHNPSFEVNPQDAHLVHYKQKHINATINGLSTVLASLLPVAAITGLFFLQSPIARLWMIGGFTVIFTIAFTLVTKARRVECFVITTALAAVMAVFVGSPNLSSCSCMPAQGG